MVLVVLEVKTDLIILCIYMTNYIEVADLGKKQNEIMYDLMQPEAAGIEGILADASYEMKEAYETLRSDWLSDDPLEPGWVENALGFKYLIKDNEGPKIMTALDKLYKSGLSLAKIEAAMNDWKTLFFTEVWRGGEVAEYEKYIRDRRNKLKSGPLEKREIKRRSKILDEMEKCMNNHLEWDFTMKIFEKFEAKFRATSSKLKTFEHSYRTKVKQGADLPELDDGTKDRIAFFLRGKAKKTKKKKEPTKKKKKATKKKKKVTKKGRRINSK